MEPTEAQQRERYYEQYLAQQHARVVFDDLFDFASEVCLVAPPEAKPPLETPAERTVVSLFGTRGIRTALEMTSPHIRLGEKLGQADDQEEQDGDEDEAPKSPLIRVDTPLLYPDLFSTDLDTSIQDKIRSFGEALIDESYVALGPEVDEKIAAIKNATTPEEQMETIKWLDERLFTMVRDVQDGEEEPRGPTDDMFAYQPYRLSPKVIGVYPNNTERPTCLGVSIIATSFLKRAGLQTLHAGVNMSGDEMTVFTGQTFTRSLPPYVEHKLGVPIPEPAREAIARTSEKMEQQTRRNDAQHAAVYAKLIDGSWAQFDSNYLATKHLDYKRVINFLDSVHDTLEQTAPFAPGVEVAGATNDPMVSTSLILADTLVGFTPEHTATHRERAVATLKNISETAMAETIFEECILPFFQPDDASEDLKADLRYLTLIERDLAGTDGSESILKSTFHTMLQKYVLWNESPEVFVDRLQNDEAYFSNRVEDLTALPFMMMVAVAKLEAEDFTPWYTHLLLDFGQPEYRIGAAVLSDFSLYYDFPLPPSFWMSYWPGNASVVEHLVGDVSVRGDYVIGFNNALYHEVHPFTSFKNSGIISSFLQENDREGE